MTIVTNRELEEVLSEYSHIGHLKSTEPYGNGHINNTFLLTYETDGFMDKRVILQEMNKEVFLNPKELMENVIGVTSYLREKIVENGGDAERETLYVIPTASGEKYYVDSRSEYWRAYAFIEGATCYEQVESKEDFYQSALAFGHFQHLLEKYPADTLHETIPQFHDTRKRFNDFKSTVAEDKMGRVSNVTKEIEFVTNRELYADVLGNMLKKKELPLRVTHNDTKLNNIMIDNKTRKGICVIDLDTVMPGLTAYDFGDSIRFGANTALEDETDLSKVSCDLELFEIYIKGFLEGCEGSLTEKEIRMLPMGAMVMTYECGMRFLTDYLEGDHYFRINYENHNLDRARTQFRLIEDMEAKWNRLMEIVENVKARDL